MYTHFKENNWYYEGNTLSYQINNKTISRPWIHNVVIIDFINKLISNKRRDRERERERLPLKYFTTVQYKLYS